jgi:hypothetical protein
VRLINPEGIQLVTATRTLRAPDARFGEPELLVRQAIEWCNGPGQDPEFPACSNDYNGSSVKTFVRARRGDEGVMTSVWVRPFPLLIENEEGLLGRPMQVWMTSVHHCRSMAVV